MRPEIGMSFAGKRREVWREGRTGAERGDVGVLRKVVLTKGAALGLTINDVPKKNKKGKRVA